MRMDDKAIKSAMKKMGIQSIDIPCKEVIIKTDGSDIIITNPQVSKINMMGQITFQIFGNVTEKARDSFSPEDIKTVMSQASVDEMDAKRALIASDGDLAAAIISLSK